MESWAEIRMGELLKAQSVGTRFEFVKSIFSTLAISAYIKNFFKIN